MAATSASPAARPARGDPGRPANGRGLVAALALTQTVGYGALYYAFAVLLAPLSASLHASTAAVTGALTASVLAGAVMAVPVGRWLDRRGGRALMSVGSVAGTLLLAAWSQVHTLGQLYAVLTGIGLVSAMVLYEPAFAVVVATTAPARRARALLGVTVVAGFASSIFLPLTGVLVDRYGWRTALLVLAALHGLITIPLHAVALPSARPARPPAPRGPARTGRGGPQRRALQDGGFWILAVVFVAQTAAVTAMTVHLVGYLISRGHRPTFAAAVAGLFGVLSVTGRLVLTGAQRRIPMTGVVSVIFAGQGAAAAALIATGAHRLGAVLAVTGFGLGFGVGTLARPALLADRYGTTGYATIAGLLTVPVTVAKAAAPLAAALLLHGSGYPAVLATIAAACAVAAGGMLLYARRPVTGGEAAVPGRAAAVGGPGGGGRRGR